VGATSVKVNLPQRRSFTLDHKGSSNRDAQWRSAGSVTGLVPAWLIAQLPRTKDPLRVDLAWDLAMTNALQGSIDLNRRGGDISFPGDAAIALGLQSRRLQARATPSSGNASILTFALNVSGKHLGEISAQGSTVAVTRDGIPE